MARTILSAQLCQLPSSTAYLQKIMALAQSGDEIVFPNGRIFCPELSLTVKDGVTLTNPKISGGYLIPDAQWSRVTASDVNHANLPAGYVDLWVAEFDKMVNPGAWPMSSDPQYSSVLDAGVHMDGIPLTRVNKKLIPTATDVTQAAFSSLPAGLDTALAVSPLQFRCMPDQEYDDNTYRKVTSIDGSNTTLHWSGNITFGSGVRKYFILENHPKLDWAYGSFWIDFRPHVQRVYIMWPTAPQQVVVDTHPANDPNITSGSMLYLGAGSNVTNGILESSRGTGWALYNKNGGEIQIKSYGCQYGHRVVYDNYSYTMPTLAVEAHYSGIMGSKISMGDANTAAIQSGYGIDSIVASHCGLRQIKWAYLVELKGAGYTIRNLNASYCPRSGVYYQVAHSTFKDSQINHTCEETGDQGAIYMSGIDSYCPGRVIQDVQISFAKRAAGVLGTFGNSGVYGDNWASDWVARRVTVDNVDMGVANNSGHRWTVDSCAFTNITDPAAGDGSGHYVFANQFSNGGDTTALMALVQANKAAWQTLEPDAYARDSTSAATWCPPTGISITGNTFPAGRDKDLNLTYNGNTEVPIDTGNVNP